MSGKVDETHAFIRAYRMTAEEEEWAMLKTIDPLRQNYPQDKETLTSLLVDAGFQDVDVRERCLTYTFTREEFVHFVYSIFGGLVSFSQMKREQPALLMDLVRAIVANYEKVKKPDTEGKISHVLEGLVASGRKGNVR